jgi:hypothetical protein
MVYDTNNHWAYGRCSSPGIPNKHKKFGKMYLLDLSRGPNTVAASHPSPEDRNDPVSKTLYFIIT